MITTHLATVVSALPIAFATFALLAGVTTAVAGTDPIEVKSFGKAVNDETVLQYILTNSSGASVRIISYGATVTNLTVPDKNGEMTDVVLGFDNIEQYETQSPYFGATIGRVGNRIAHGMFKLDTATYAVPINNGPNHLHGGFRGYDKRIWTGDACMTTDGPSVRFTLVDPDGTEGYPGTVKVSVIYSFSGANTLKIQYYATTDHPTPMNLTNHTYFNLKDGGASKIDGHLMQINADQYTPVDATLIPTGELAAVKGTAMDFTSPKPIGKDIAAAGGDPAGYDHNMVLRSGGGVEMSQAAVVTEPTTGRVMEVWTTEPGVQFYSGNFLDGSVKGKNRIAYERHGAFCLETQHFPDSVNHPKFPSTILVPGQVYRQVTEYRFPTPWSSGPK